MTRADLFQQIKKKKSFLCIGLDSDTAKLPKHLLKSEDPVFEFNRQIIDATQDLCIAYKPNFAFYESGGATGQHALEKTFHAIPKDIFSIADAKRGDIGNTSDQYARAVFRHMAFDSVTVSPYMGRDSVSPFLKYDGKWVIILALTSNEGSADFQMSELNNGKLLFEHVLETSSSWGSEDNTMYVVGATHPSLFNKVRRIVPHHFLLVPGVGAQGGDLSELSSVGMNESCGLIVNASRQVIFASAGEDFADAARREALKLQQAMEVLLDRFLK